MAATAQLRGMLLEEIVLKFLKVNGCNSILDAGSDPTLENGPSGIEVVGRGTSHQIDAIADYRFPASCSFVKGDTRNFVRSPLSYSRNPYRCASLICSLKSGTSHD